jgi:hypothetical protein
MELFMHCRHFTIRRAITAVLLIGYAILGTGCGKKLPPGKVQVQGVVMLDDKPLTHSGKGLFAVNLSTTKNATGSAARFDPTDGSFAMVVEPGEYVATVTATDGFDSDEGGKIIYAKSLVPKKYTSLQTSDVAVTVPATGGRITIPLKRN